MQDESATNGHGPATDPTGEGGLPPESGLPVLSGTEARPLMAPQASALPAPIVAATGGLIVGAATWMLVRILRRPARRKAGLKLGRGRKGRGLEVTGSRSFLVDVHMLKR
jgi:hypothetical protein